MKTLIIYCYAESVQTKNNLMFFIKNGIILSDDYYYVFIINDNQCTVNFPSYNNIKVLYRNENENDLYTYKWYINNTQDDYFLEYSYFYFINSSCIGPFLPPICTNNWIDLMNIHLNKYSLIGPIAEIPLDNKYTNDLNVDDSKNIPFIHSYMFAVNSFGFKIIKYVFDNMLSNKKQYALDAERQITMYNLKNGGKIKSFLVRFQHVDLNNPDNWNFNKFNLLNKPPCYEVPNNYFGIDINPFEIIFVKNIRNQNESRDAQFAGISETLKLYINRYKDWINNEFIVDNKEDSILENFIENQQDNISYSKLILLFFLICIIIYFIKNKK